MTGEPSIPIVVRVESADLDREEREELMLALARELRAADVTVEPIAATTSTPGTKGPEILQEAFHLMYTAPAEVAVVLALEKVIRLLRKNTRLVLETPKHTISLTGESEADVAGRLHEIVAPHAGGTGA